MTLTLPDWKRIRPIGFIGASAAGGEEYRTAYRLARVVAELGRPVLTGGLGGVMEAASRGAMDAGGVSIAVLPDVDADAANPYATIVLATDLGRHDEAERQGRKDYSRNRIIATASDFIVAVSGACGTANEIKLALRFGRIVIGVRGSPHPEDAGNLSPAQLAGYHRMATPDHAEEAIRRLLARTPGA